MKQPTHVEVPLTQGLFALVDAEDAEAVLAHRWHAHRERTKLYALRAVYLGGGRKNQVSRRVGLHNFLTGWPMVDHINGDGLDCRRANLRQATVAQNNLNKRIRSGSTSGYKGVWIHPNGRARAYINIDERRRHLGYHGTPEAAAEAYDEAAREAFGEWACLNFPGTGERGARPAEAGEAE